MNEGSVFPCYYPDFFAVVSDKAFDESAKKKASLVYKVYEVKDEIMVKKNLMK